MLVAGPLDQFQDEVTAISGPDFPRALQILAILREPFFHPAIVIHKQYLIAKSINDPNAVSI